MEASQLKTLSGKVEQLLNYCQTLEADNLALKSSQDDWLSERTKLLQKNDLAKNKIESMIGRLKALEQG
ncbi:MULTISPECIES: TIGR02449 family protein [unclassified Oleiphilus]|jgi:cell division protein ZapB|uniref:TIGR02449 family protein n=1 Tax=unclassified Oleiphilus TaxID=2631174 RepID=UPI0007C32D6E|nr:MULTISPECIES: TIGR02449 family protein [unclassified Oleiphilus]KZY74699.1 TIGR02449 family protein [Oleiphilus sp. HI0068]KZY84839.1 TIGR02449 family protein [Oleiphilus sp. HI0069]KZY95812.1 TIGR02449 family protein [Oleiphilus sp. HI0072]KZZ09528.1 TIGR02449 family protein [Oleiphilus sp. HI0078]KZZ25441.1 TIGR02449 family protein [Oleiphilus sp. HI0081]